MQQMIRRRLTTVVAAVAVTLALIVPMTAMAADELMSELPQTQDTLVVVDFDRLNDSPVYDRVFQLLADQPMARGMLKQLENELGIDPREDLEALVMTSDSPPLSMGMLQQQDPTQAVQTAARHDSQSLFVVRGSFDVDEVLATAASQFDGERTDDNGPVRTDQFYIRGIDDQTIAVAAGTAGQLDKMSRELAGDQRGIGTKFESALQRLGNSRGLYVMIEPTIENPQQLRDATGANASFAGFSIDLADSVQISMIMTLEDDDQARQSVEEIDQLRSNAGNNPMTELLGFGPLVANLSVQQDGPDVLVHTSMTNPEATRLLDRVVSILQTEQELQQPLEGDGFDPADEDEDEESSGDGVDADFN